MKKSSSQSAGLDAGKGPRRANSVTNRVGNKEKETKNDAQAQPNRDRDPTVTSTSDKVR